MQIKCTLKIEQTELGIHPTESEWKQEIDRWRDMLFLRCNGWKCKTESNVSMGQRKVTLVLAIFAICRFPDDCTHKCIVTVATLLFTQFRLSPYCFSNELSTRQSVHSLAKKDSEKFSVFSDIEFHQNRWSISYSIPSIRFLDTFSPRS